MKTTTKIMTAGALAVATFLGAAGGSMVSSLVASADSNSGTGSTGTTAALTVASTSPSPGGQSGPGGAGFDPSRGGHTANGITETVLTGDNATRAKAAAEAAEPGATVIRAETDAEGAAYEVHLQKSDGSYVTVKLDSNFKVTGTENGFGGGAPGGPGGTQTQVQTQTN
jgi:hypothetical protein